MTALTIATPVLPTPSNPVPSVTNQRLLQSLSGSGHYLDKIKAGVIRESDLPALQQLEAEVSPTMEPAKPYEVAAVLDRLFSHYPRPEMPAHMAENRLADWYSDLSGIPLDVLEATARDWRRSDARFAPTPGQFLEKAARYHEPRKYAAGIVRMVIAALESTANTNDPSHPPAHGEAA